MIKKIFLLIAVFYFVFNAQTVRAQSIAQPADTLNLIEKVERWYEGNMNYASITALMTVESSFIPFPSEIVIPPAAYIASKPDSKLNIYLVVLFGTLGALIGAYINYFLALWLGRPIIYKLADSKIGHMLLLSGEKIEKAEEYFNKRGKVSTFVGRLIPGIRQLISVPAGLARMNLMSFTFYTFLGALIWNGVLAYVGYLAHGQADLIHEYSRELSIFVLVLIVLFVSFFVAKYFISRRRKKNNA